jgi:phage tail-like protein
MSPGARDGSFHDAHAAARYAITVDGAEVAQFAELVALTSALERQQKGEVGREVGARRVEATVTLQRGQTNDLSVFEWHRDALGRDRPAGRNAVLVVYAVDGQPIAQYQLTNAWPAKVVISTQQAGASEVLYETVTLTCDDIERVSH